MISGELQAEESINPRLEGGIWWLDSNWRHRDIKGQQVMHPSRDHEKHNEAQPGISYLYISSAASDL